MSANPQAFGFAIITVQNLTQVQPATATILANSACTVNMAYFTPSGTPYTPSALRYRIDDYTSGQNIVPLTGLPNSATSVVEIQGAQNMMISLTEPSEAHVLTVQISDSLGNAFYQAASFNVLRAVGTTL